MLWTDPSGEQSCEGPYDPDCQDAEFPPSWQGPQEQADFEGYERAYYHDLYDHGLVSRLKDEILQAASYHAQPSDGFGRDALAILIGAILIVENQYNEAIWNGFGSRRWQGDMYNLNAPWSGDYRNPSTGIANIRPSLVQEMLNGIIPDIDEEHWVCLPFETADRFHPMHLVADLYGGEPEFIFAQLQDEIVSIDLLGVNLRRGIIRAQALGIRPSVFNLATWRGGGVQTPRNILNNSNKLEYGRSVLALLGASASLLDLDPGLVQGMPLYNSEPVAPEGLSEVTIIQHSWLQHRGLLKAHDSPGW
jgi:hypothetical protein